ncbi:MAG: ABC transporter substrate-binding protein [Planctomycetes bacterium]|nr:ABC transporter substrate-binding protein [Planctomycetota bacterium]
MADRIVSLDPGATELLFALGLSGRVVGVTHECDEPPEAALRRVVTEPVLSTKGKSSSQIEREVADRLKMGLGLWRVDAQALEELAPDLVVSPGPQEEGGASHREVARILEKLPRRPKVFCVEPRRLDDLSRIAQGLGEACDCTESARSLAVSIRRQLDAARARGEESSMRPTACCLEWLDPLRTAGRWIPDMVVLAGGEDGFGRAGPPGERITWEAVRVGSPEVLLFLPHGFGLDRTVQEAPLLVEREGWKELPAVREGRVYALNGEAFFHRFGPRLLSGIDVLFGILHPEQPETLPPSGSVWHLEA